MNREQRRSKRQSSIRSLILPVFGFFLVAAGVAWFFESQSTTTLIVVRHAEKADEPVEDPGLSAQGQLRARELAEMLTTVDVVGGVDAIYVTQYQRTRETAKPLADRLNIAVQIMAADDYAGLEKKILGEHRGEIVLIVGHSNTIPKIIAEFGGSKRIPPIKDEEYRDLFIVSIPW